LWFSGLRSDDLTVVSSSGTAEERDNKVPPPYATNLDARQLVREEDEEFLAQRRRDAKEEKVWSSGFLKLCGFAALREPFFRWFFTPALTIHLADLLECL
jgi:hypothetical protein